MKTRMHDFETIQWRGWVIIALAILGITQTIEWALIAALLIWGF